nr:ADM_HP1_G0005910.mRNA.1.CDS.1 [Saccharomyces cerevisiae]
MMEGEQSDIKGTIASDTHGNVTQVYRRGSQRIEDTGDLSQKLRPGCRRFGKFKEIRYSYTCTKRNIISL